MMVMMLIITVVGDVSDIDDGIINERTVDVDGQHHDHHHVS